MDEERAEEPLEEEEEWEEVVFIDRVYARRWRVGYLQHDTVTVYVFDHPASAAEAVARAQKQFAELPFGAWPDGRFAFGDEYEYVLKFPVHDPIATFAEEEGEDWWHTIRRS